MKTEIKKIFKKRNPNTSKHDYGHLLIIAGSVGMTGAAVMAAQAALRSGAGLVTVGTPKSLNSILATKLTCAMTLPLPETKEQSLSRKARDEILKFTQRSTAVCIGPGLSRQVETRELVRHLVTAINLPMIIDADGLNALTGEVSILRKRKNSILITPHPGELSRLINKSKQAIEKNRTKIVKDLAKRITQVVVLKGNNTLVSSADGIIYRNTTGNPGMATGGAGDVLSGMIGAFLAQGIKPYPAAKSAVYLHGLAGDLARDEVGEISLTALDILHKIPAAFGKTLNPKP